MTGASTVCLFGSRGILQYELHCTNSPIASIKFDLPDALTERRTLHARSVYVCPSTRPLFLFLHAFHSIQYCIASSAAGRLCIPPCPSPEEHFNARGIWSMPRTRRWADWQPSWRQSFAESISQRTPLIKTLAITSSSSTPTRSSSPAISGRVSAISARAIGLCVLFGVLIFLTLGYLLFAFFCGGVQTSSTDGILATPAD